MDCHIIRLHQYSVPAILYSGLRLVAGQHGDSRPDGGGGGGADVILATSNSYKATADAIKGLRPDGV